MCSCLRLLVLPLVKASGLAAAPAGTAWRGQAAFSIFCWLEIADFDHFLHRVSDVTVFLLSHIYLTWLIVCVSFAWFCPSLMYCVKFCDRLREKFGIFAEGNSEGFREQAKAAKGALCSQVRSFFSSVRKDSPMGAARFLSKKPPRW
jgi:hypothetical protein